MALRDDIPLILGKYQQVSEFLCHNRKLYEVYEGDLLTQLLQDLSCQLSARNFEQIKFRAAPINISKRVVDKLSKIYAKPPQRVIEGLDGQDAKKEIVGEIIDEMRPNVIGSVANEYFNLYKGSALEPYLAKDGDPSLRAIPYDRFFVMGTNRVDPLEVTHFVKIMGCYQKEVGRTDSNQTTTTYRSVDLLYVFTDTEFMIIDADGDQKIDMMTEAGNPGGVNPYGRIPFVYLNRSLNQITPMADTDMLAMTKVVPIILSDLNFAAMYQCFSIIYGIDIDSSNIVMSPNAFWNFVSDPKSDKTPSVGTLTPTANIDQILGLVKTELSMWLESRGIKPGAIGDLTPQNAASGLAKMIDEMDTSEDRQKQVPYFESAEEDLWDLYFNHMHPVFQKAENYVYRAIDLPEISVDVKFPEQRGDKDPATLLDSIQRRMQLRLMTREMALKELNPDSTQEQIDKILAEIEADTTVDLTPEPPNVPAIQPAKTPQ